MPLRTSCPHCHTRQTVPDALAGKRARCPHCEQPFVLRARPGPHRPSVPSPPGRGPDDPGGNGCATPPLARKARRRLTLGAGIALGLLLGACVILYLLTPSEVDGKLNALKAGNPQARAQALAWLVEADPQDADRARVTATLEPLLLDGDPHQGLDPDLLLRAYLRWAGQRNIPALVRMVRTPPLPSWSPGKTGSVMLALGRLRDGRAAQALADKLPDPLLHDQAITALQLLGPAAEPAVLDHLFDEAPGTRRRASQLLADYGTSGKTITAAALDRLRSGQAELQVGAARWFAENPPAGAEKAPVARALGGLLESLSPEVTAQALRALKLWATRGTLPQLLALAQREAAGGTDQADRGDRALIEVLAQFPDEGAAEAIALQLRSASQRGKAVQALLKLGPVATRAVLGYLNDPDPAVQSEARGLVRPLNISAERQLEQTLTDVADTRRERSRAALQYLAQLRPQEASRARVSRSLNAPLLDPDLGMRADALNAIAVWGSKESTPALLKVLGDFRGEGAGGDAHVIAVLGALKDPAAAQALARGLTHPRERGAVGWALRAIGPGAEGAVIPFVSSVDQGARIEACRVLAAIGTARSMEPLDQAMVTYYRDVAFVQQAQIASQQIAARK
jgi:predicted Zn finger-like uncharacterized protein